MSKPARTPQTEPAASVLLREDRGGVAFLTLNRPAARNALNEELLDKYNKLLAGSEKDNAKLSGDLQTTQAALLKKQDELNALAAQLDQQKKDLNALADQLKQREARVNELENILKQKDQAAADLKKKLSDALGKEADALRQRKATGAEQIRIEQQLADVEAKRRAVETDAASQRKQADNDHLTAQRKLLEINEQINLSLQTYQRSREQSASRQVDAIGHGSDYSQQAQILDQLRAIAGHHDHVVGHRKQGFDREIETGARGDRHQRLGQGLGRVAEPTATARSKDNTFHVFSRFLVAVVAWANLGEGGASRKGWG